MNPLPTDICVPELFLLRYFATDVQELPADQQPAAKRRFDAALQLEFTAMLIGALAVDIYWTDRSVLLQNLTLNYLRDSSLLPSFEVPWVDCAESGSFTLRNVIDLSIAVK